MYKFLRLGQAGYRSKVALQMSTAEFIRSSLLGMTLKGEKRFVLLDGSAAGPALPVVAMRLNPKLNLAYDSIDLQHIISERNWFVSAYKMKFSDPLEEGTELPLFEDASSEDTMFRVVVKATLTLPNARDLVDAFRKALEFLDMASNGYLDVHNMRLKKGEQHHDGHVC